MEQYKLHEDNQICDEVKIFTVIRWKDSELSGCLSDKADKDGTFSFDVDSYILAEAIRGARQ